MVHPALTSPPPPPSAPPAAVDLDDYRPADVVRTVTGRTAFYAPPPAGAPYSTAAVWVVLDAESETGVDFVRTEDLESPLTLIARDGWPVLDDDAVRRAMLAGWDGPGAAYAVCQGSQPRRFRAYRVDGDLGDLIGGSSTVDGGR